MRFLTTSLIFFLWMMPAYAAKVIAVKNGKVLLEMENEAELTPGDRLGARNLEGKAQAMLEVTQVKNLRAIATISRGNMQADYTVAKLGGSKAAASSSTKTPSLGKLPPKKRSGDGWGLMAGYAMNSMTVKPTSGSSISLTGTSFNLSGFYQMHLDGRFSARLLGGYETLVASGDSVAGCQGSSSCKVDISYLGIEALGTFALVKNESLDMWVGAGLGFLFAISKDSNVLNTSKISTNQTIVVSVGMDYYLNHSSFIPLQFDYAMYPDNSTSSANQMILRAGYGFSF